MSQHGIKINDQADLGESNIDADLQMEPIISSGSEIQPTIIDSRDRITYTWSDVNVYHTSSNNRSWDRFFVSKKQVEQRHILKDGENKKIYIYILILPTYLIHEKNFFFFL